MAAKSEWHWPRCYTYRTNVMFEPILTRNYAALLILGQGFCIKWRSRNR